MQRHSLLPVLMPLLLLPQVLLLHLGCQVRVESRGGGAWRVVLCCCCWPSCVLGPDLSAHRVFSAAFSPFEK